VAVLTATWALRLDNQRLAAEAEARLLDIVESLIASVEAKDVYTSGHSKRVCRYSVLIAEQLGLTGRALDDVAIGAALHDVGKIKIPDHVLCKPGKMDDAEWQLMKSHPKVGARIVDSFNQSPAVLHIIFHHHERYDGRGYPAGLEGEAIPLVARIAAVADALDAMTSGRIYQRNRSLLEALDELRANAGKQFDPKVVEAALSLPRDQLQAVVPKLPTSPTDAPTGTLAESPAPAPALVTA
jgi:putative nucleotidyltransferase with HDIG domain